MIDKGSLVPAYIQLKMILSSQIEAGVWKQGECILSERELSEIYGISRMTIRQALAELVQEGILIKKKGKGTFVSDTKFTQKNIMSFSEIIKEADKKLENVILDFKIINTPKELKSIFNEDKLFFINRNRVVDNEVIANEVIYMPYSLGKTLTREELKNSIYKFLESINQGVSHSESTINSILCNEENRKLFEINVDLPLLKIDNKVYNYSRRLLFIESAVYRSDKYTLEINISKKRGM